MITTIHLNEAEIKKAITAYILKETGVYAESIELRYDAGSSHPMDSPTGYSATVSCKGRKTLSPNDYVAASQFDR